MNARNACIAAACVLLSACATPRPVLELADKTSANVGIVSARLRQLSEESNRLYASRVDNISRLQGVNATFRARLAYDMALTKKVGQQADLELIGELQTWVREVDQIFAAAAGAEQEQRDALLAGQTKIDAKSQALQKVAETLSALAKEESESERVKILQKFVGEVRDDMKKQLDDGSRTAAAAKALLDQVRSDLRAAPQQ